MMTCRELIDVLADYLEGELPEPVRAELDRHLALCPQCVDYLNTYGDAIRLGKLACHHEDCGRIPDELVQGILRACKADPRSQET